jgi:hypothetical protein
MFECLLLIIIMIGVIMLDVKVHNILVTLEAILRETKKGNVTVEVKTP